MAGFDKVSSESGKEKVPQSLEREAVKERGTF